MWKYILVVVVYNIDKKKKKAQKNTAVRTYEIPNILYIIFFSIGFN